MRGELDYYSSRSGLPAGTLGDHKLAYFKAQTGGSGSLADCMAQYFSSQGKGSLAANQFAYYAAQTGAQGSLADLMQAFYLNPPGGLGPIVAGTTPTLTPSARTFSYNNVAELNTQLTLTPNANTQLGDIIFAVIAGTNTTATVTPPGTGWTAITVKNITNSLYTWAWWRKRGVGETTYAFTFDNGGAGSVGALYVVSRAASPSIVSAIVNRTVDKTNTIPSITTVVANTLALAIATERTTADETAVTTVPAGWTELGFARQTATAIETIWGGTKLQASAGATGTADIVWPNTQTQNGSTVTIGLPPKDLSARVTDIAHWAAQTDAYIAHRGFSKSFPEMTKFAYDEAVMYGANAIEISVWSSSTGTFWAIHDNDLTIRTNGTGNVTAATDATLAGLTVNAGGTGNTSQVGQPLSKLSDILASYGDNVVVFIEAKSMYTVGADAANLATVIKAQPHWQDRFIWKQSGTANPFAARPTGIKTWGYFFDTDMGVFATQQSKFDYVGLDYNSSDATLTTAISSATPGRVIAHILSSPAQITRFQGFGVHKFMCSDASVVPAA
jgi:hypothetical protein